MTVFQSRIAAPFPSHSGILRSRSKRRLLTLALGATLVAPLADALAAPPPSALTVGGVTYPPQLTVGGRPLLLNGAGVRHKVVIKVYTAGLYLSERADTPEAVLAMPGPKRVHIVMLREIDANELGKLFVRGMRENSPREEFVKSIPGTIRMGQIFADKKRLQPGESFGIEWVPGTGSVVRINGEPLPEAILEAEFFNAVLRIWLGPAPADHLLKDALLGRSPRRVNDA